ncbi:MAG TPA: M1 family peptidase, partial [Thermoanaerobaculia bacterium]|nr:M1 family peptidase [Thermoanaerobaculia bacterium]
MIQRRVASLPSILLTVLALPAYAVAESRPLTAPIASYEISCRLDAERRTIEGTELLTWTNRTSRPAGTLQFHLYLNAFRNTLSTLWKESRGEDRE